MYKIASKPSVAFAGVVPLDSIKGENIVSSSQILSTLIKQGVLDIQHPKWRVYADHMTINRGRLERKELVNENVIITATHIGYLKSDSEQEYSVVAIRVDSPMPTQTSVPHITIAVNDSVDATPEMSNSISDWIPIIPFQISGKVLEISDQKKIVTEEEIAEYLRLKDQRIQERQEEQKKNSPVTIIREQGLGLDQAKDLLVNRGIPEQAWSNILRITGLI